MEEPRHLAPKQEGFSLSARVWSCMFVGQAKRRPPALSRAQFSRSELFEHGARLGASALSDPYMNPKSRPMECTANATSQATAHWNTTMPAAHLAPSSRLMAAMAATQGV